MSTPELIERIRGAVERLVASPMGEDPDSPYARLLELVKVRCFCINHQGYCSRSWEGMPGWWLATLLVSAAVKARLTLVSDASMGALMEDPDKAGAAVLVALERRGAHGQV